MSRLHFPGAIAVAHDRGGEDTGGGTGSCDVAVIGAGPAGSTAALHLARRGCRVLLLDRDPFPRDKVCGDALIPDAIRAAGRASVLDAIRQHGRSLTAATMFSPSRVHFDVDGTFITIKRLVLDDLLRRAAVEQGAAFEVADVLNVRTNGATVTVSTTCGAVTARVALIATGARVGLAARLNLIERQTPTAIALRCYVRSTMPLDRLVITYDRSILPGYAWIFPLRDGEFNVGCGAILGGESPQRVNLRDVFARFRRTFPLAVDLFRRATDVSPLRGAMLRCGLTGARPHARGNVLVIGETLGTTYPFTGEGIGKAMETGELAAEVTAAALATGRYSGLSRFGERVQRELAPKFLGYQLAQRWFSHAWLTDLVARRAARSAYLRDALSGVLDETIDPRAVFSPAGILRSFLS